MSVISADEIIAELRRVFPSHRLELRPERGVPRGLLLSHDYLYGVPIFVYGEGYKGQYLRHAVYERDGKRYWLIEYGRSTLYGVTEDGNTVPLVVLGVPTQFVFTYKPQEFKRFYLEEVPLGKMEVREDTIVNLQRAMSGRDPMLVVDKYGLLRQGLDGDEVDRVLELQFQIEQLQAALFEYERIVRDQHTTIRLLETRLAKYRELLAEYEARLVKLTSEVTAIQAELIRLRDEIAVRSVEEEVREEVLSKIQDLINELTKVLESAVTTIRHAQAATQQLAAAGGTGGGGGKT